MIIPLFPIISSDPACTALLGAAPTRFYPFGLSPQPGQSGYAEPYVTHQVITGLPENYIGDRPDIDSATVQIDIWSSDPLQIDPLTTALRDALEPHGHITRWGKAERDAETKLYRFGFDLDYWLPR